MSNNEVDETVSSLPPRILKLIDNAFDKAIAEAASDGSAERPRKRRRTLEEDAPGGFLIDDDSAQGGFMLDESEDTAPTNTEVESHIPLSLIPRALQLLDLPPDDQEVLHVFANAASGWEGRSDFDPDGLEEKAVSRKDWRAVCSVLVPSAPQDEHQYDNASSHSELSSLSPLSSDEYVEDDEAEDEYVPGDEMKERNRNQKPRKKSNKNGRSSVNDLDQDFTERSELTARQKREALAAFSLFFPGLPFNPDDTSTEEALRKKRLTAQDIASSAGSIKEKINAEEIIEMLALFSSKPSASGLPSMALEDFERMLVAMRLI